MKTLRLLAAAAIVLCLIGSPRTLATEKPKVQLQTGILGGVAPTPPEGSWQDGVGRADMTSGPAPERSHVLRQDGGRLAYYHWPKRGPSLLLIPGSWNEYRQFDAMRRHLDPDLNLVIVELPGHGRSRPPTLEGSIESFAEDVLRVADALDWKSWYVGGHSIGGMVAIELARRRPEGIAGVISIEGWTHHRVQSDAFSDHMYDTLSQTQEKQRQQAGSRTKLRLNQEQEAAFVGIWTRWDGQPILRTTSAAVLEIWGDRNQKRPSRQTMRIPDRDNIQLHWIAAASHSLPLEKPKEVAAAINQFIHIRERVEHEQMKSR